MNEIMLDCESYVLNDFNMQNYLKCKFIPPNNSVKINNKMENVNNQKLSNLFVPIENDTLFWCYYIIQNGDANYEMLKNKNNLIAKQLKIGLVSKIRENKQILKLHKFDSLTNIESNLANDNLISVKTFMSICAIDNINVVFIRKNTYYEFLANDSGVFFIIREIYNNNNLRYGKRYGYEIASEDSLSNIRMNYYKIDSIDKPIKSLSAYKLSDLINIANKLTIETVNKTNGKNKTKNELYELIVQYF